MEWLNLKLSDVRSPQFVGSDPVERSTWISLLAYCVDQENGGVIAGAAGWKDRQWQQACGVTAREVRRATKLLRIMGDDVRVMFYPIEKEQIVRRKREIGRRGGEASGEARAKHMVEPNGEPNARTEGEWNRKENGNIPPPPREADDTPDELLTEAQATTQAHTAGVPADFATYVFPDWHSRGGKDAGGVKVAWAGYVKKRWNREQHEWINGTHRGKQKGNHHARSNERTGPAERRADREARLSTGDSGIPRGRTLSA